MTALQERINQEINKLPLISQKEVLDFILFIQQKINTETDSDYLSKNPKIKNAIIEGLNTPLNECSTQLEW
jgi:hypothetical protein